VLRDTLYLHFDATPLTLTSKKGTMAERKADSNSPSKRHPKKIATSQKHSIKPETPAAKAYRRKRAAKLAQAPSKASQSGPEAYDVYAFPPTLPSRPLSAKEAPPSLPKVDLTESEDEEATRNGEQSVVTTFPISGTIPEDDTLLAILCVFHDNDLTEVALDAIMQKAAAAAKPGDELGILYMRKLVSKLANTPIEPEWLARIIDLIQQTLESLCDRVKCQIRSLGKLPLPKQAKMQALADTTQVVDIIQLLGDGAPDQSFEATKIKQTANSANAVVGAKLPNSDTVPVRNKQSQRKTKARPQPAPMQSSPTKNSTVTIVNAQQSKSSQSASESRLSGESFDSVYDLFVRSATDANCFASETNGEANKAYRKRIHKAWSHIEPEQRAAWVKLLNTRPDVIPMSVKGQKLLWSQGLIAKLLPTDHKRKRKY
jgi:hypothetical protein